MPAPPAPDAYLEPYRQSQRRHGAGFDVTLWASPQSQRRRFEVFTDMCFLTGKLILDAGCSRGDFAAYLVERRVAFDRYVGIDALKEVIEFARARNLPRCDFISGDFVSQPFLLEQPKPQIVTISGTLTTMADPQVFMVLEAAWNACSQVLLFNFLSDRCGPQAPPQDGFARRLDMMRLLEWSLAQTPMVAFRQDYFPYGHDATIMMRKL